MKRIILNSVVLPAPRTPLEFHTVLRSIGVPSPTAGYILDATVNVNLLYPALVKCPPSMLPPLVSTVAPLIFTSLKARHLLMLLLQSLLQHQPKIDLPCISPILTSDTFLQAFHHTPYGTELRDTAADKVSFLSSASRIPPVPVVDVLVDLHCNTPAVTSDQSSGIHAGMAASRHLLAKFLHAVVLQPPFHQVPSCWDRFRWCHRLHLSTSHALYNQLIKYPWESDEEKGNHYTSIALKPYDDLAVIQALLECGYQDFAAFAAVVTLRQTIQCLKNHLNSLSSGPNTSAAMDCSTPNLEWSFHDLTLTINNRIMHALHILDTFTTAFFRPEIFSVASEDIIHAVQLVCATLAAQPVVPQNVLVYAAVMLSHFAAVVPRLAGWASDTQHALVQRAITRPLPLQLWNVLVALAETANTRNVHLLAPRTLTSCFAASSLDASQMIIPTSKWSFLRHQIACLSPSSRKLLKINLEGLRDEQSLPPSITGVLELLTETNPLPAQETFSADLSRFTSHPSHHLLIPDFQLVHRRACVDATKTTAPHQTALRQLRDHREGCPGLHTVDQYPLIVAALCDIRRAYAECPKIAQKIFLRLTCRLLLPFLDRLEPWLVGLTLHVLDKDAQLVSALAVKSRQHPYSAAGQFLQELCLAVTRCAQQFCVEHVLVAFRVICRVAAMKFDAGKTALHGLATRLWDQDGYVAAPTLLRAGLRGAGIFHRTLHDLWLHNIVLPTLEKTASETKPPEALKSILLQLEAVGEARPILLHSLNRINPSNDWPLSTHLAFLRCQLLFDPDNHRLCAATQKALLRLARLPRNVSQNSKSKIKSPDAADLSTAFLLHFILMLRYPKTWMKTLSDIPDFRRLQHDTLAAWLEDECTQDRTFRTSDTFSRFRAALARLAVKNVRCLEGREFLSGISRGIFIHFYSNNKTPPLALLCCSSVQTAIISVTSTVSTGPYTPRVQISAKTEDCYINALIHARRQALQLIGWQVAIIPLSEFPETMTAHQFDTRLSAYLDCQIDTSPEAASCLEPRTVP